LNASAGLPQLCGVDVHAPVALLDKPRHCLALAVERPGQHRLAQRQGVAPHAVITGVPNVPGFSVAVHLAAYQLVPGHLGQARGDELAGKDRAIVRVPVLLLRPGKSLEQPLGDNVLDAVQVRFGRVAVEERALSEVFVDLLAKVMCLHLVQGISFHRMEADEIYVQSIGRRTVLQGGRARLQDVRLDCL
jgi:hypothetical protein